MSNKTHSIETKIIIDEKDSTMIQCPKCKSSDVMKMESDDFYTSYSCNACNHWFDIEN